MITMQEYINNIRNPKTTTPLKKEVEVNNIVQNETLKEDKFEKSENKKIDKNKIIKIGAVLTSILIAITAFLKRKQIMNFISNFSKKKEQIPPKPASIEPSDVSPANIQPNKIQHKIQESIFPTPKFTSNPNAAQRDEYVDELIKYMNSTPDTKLQLKALKEIEKYGIGDIDDISTMMLSEDESVIRETLKIYQKCGTDKDVFDIIGPIRRETIEIKEDETFIEVLKTIQKLAQLQNDDPKDKEIILKPIRRLLNHKSESVRKIAQETLDKLKNQ